jgi:glutamate 5-kinase
VANLVDADLLVLLTDLGGLYTADPRTTPGAELIPRVDRVDSRIEALAGTTQSEVSVGGMATKIQAARLATSGGTDMVIADGKEPDVLVRVARGEEMGTYFPAATNRMESRRRWMLAGLSLKGDIVVDEGAAKALRDRKTSLLPAGVSDIRGTFKRGDAVAIVDAEGQRIACGITNYAAADIDRIKGLRSDRIEGVLGHQYGSEVMHRDNMVLL